MPGISNRDSFFKKLHDLTNLLDKQKSFPTENAKIKKLTESIFDYIQKHPELKSDLQVKKAYKKIASLTRQQDPSTEGKTDRIIAHRIPSRSFPPKPQSRVNSTLPLTTAAAESAPQGSFIVDKGAEGNCASLSLLDQLQQRGILNPSNHNPFTSQEEVRICVSSYLREHLTDISDELAGNIYQSLREAQQDGIFLSSDLQAVLTAEAASSSPLSDRNKLVLLTGYADLIETDGFWLDKGFFEVACIALGTQIVILRLEETSDLVVYDRFPRTYIDPARSLFIYYNGVAGGGGGNHFQSIGLSHKQKLSTLVNKDNEQKVIDFIEGVKEQKDLLKTKEQRRSGLTVYLQDLERVYPEAYQAVWSLIKEKSRTNVRESDGISKNVMSLLFTLSTRAILKKIQEKKTSQAIPQTLGLSSTAETTKPKAHPVKPSEVFTQKLLEQPVIPATRHLEIPPSTEMTDSEPLPNESTLGSPRHSLATPTSARILFNLLADEFGANSELEGISPGKILLYVTDFIREQRSLTSSFTEILKELEMACRIESEGLSTVLPEALAANKPFIFPAGWIGFPAGHVVYYEVFPQEDGTVDFRIFNTGAGIDEHQKVQVGGKKKVAYLEWKGISQSRLLDSRFSRIIKELKTETEYFDPENPYYRQKQTDYSATDIYRTLKSYLQPTSITHGLDAPLMEPQRAGTCACRSLFAFLKSKMPLEEYQRLKLDLRIGALSGFINSPIESTSSDVQYHLVNRATEKLSRRVSDLFRKRVIETSTLIAAKEQVERADMWLTAHRIKKPAVSMEQNSTQPMNILACDLAPPIVDLLARPEGIPPIETPLSPILSRIALYPLNNPTTFTENIQKVSAILKEAYDNKEYRAVHFAIIELIKKIPLDEKFWKEIKKTQPEIEKAIDEVAILSELFFKSCYRIKDSSPIFREKQYALTKLLFTQQGLARLLSDKISLCCSYAKSPSYYMLELDPIMETRMDAIQNDSDNATFFSEYTYACQAPPSRLCYSTYSPIRTPFIALIKERYPEILVTIKKENPGFDTKKEEEQYMLIFLSDHLPSWIQSLKKSSLCLAFLENEPIVPFEDQRVSLDFKYENKGHEIFISLEGITPQNFTHLKEGLEQATPCWSGTQAPVKEPMIRDLIHLLSYLKRENSNTLEKALYSTGSRSMSIFDFKHKYASRFSESTLNELLHIFTSNSHGLIETLAYFTRYPDKIRDLDYQQVFQIACFNLKASKQIESFTNQIFSFLTKQMTSAHNEEDVKSQVFLQRMGRYFRRYECAAPDKTDDLLHLLTLEKTSPEEKSLIYAELAAALGERSTLTDKEATLLLKATAWIEHAPIPTHWKDPKTAYDIENALCKHAEALSKLLLPEGIPNTPLLNEIYILINEKLPPADLTWESIHTEGMSPRFSSNYKDFYDLMSRRLITIGLEGYIPLDIRDQLYFKELFPHQVKGIALSNDVYEFTHEGNRVIVRKTELGLSFELYTKEGQWLRLIPNDQLTSVGNQTVTSPLESRYLADKYHVWHSITDPTKIFLFDKKTNTKTHEIGYYSGYVAMILRLSDYAVLHKASGLLAHFEDPSYIQEWYKGDKRIEVELPRFNLSFTPDDMGRLECKQHPGFFLSEDPNLHAIGECKYALILKDKDGKIRVLLPNQHLEKPPSLESLEPKFIRNQALKKGETADFTYFTYNLTSNGHLECSSKEGYFTLAQTLAVHHDYKKAAYYLRNYGKKLSAYSPNEIQALEEIVKISSITGDKSGEQGAIALYATYLLATNKIRSPDAIKALPDLYTQYLLRLSNITALRLSTDEELHILKSLLTQPLSPEFATRLFELNPTSLPLIGTILPTKPSEMFKSIDLRQIRYIYQDEKKPLPPDFLQMRYPLITRPADFIKKHLVELVKLAIQGSSEEKKWIETASLFLKTNTKDRDNANLGGVFEIILENPQQFDLPPDLSSPSQSIENWWHKTLDKAQSLVPPQAISSTPTLAAPSPLFLTPRTDRDPIEIPDFPFRFTPESSLNLIEIEPFSTWTTESLHPISENSELRDFLSSQRSDDPVESAEWTRLQKDAEALAAKPGKTLYTFKTELPAITPVLQRKKTEIEESLTTLQTAMIQLAETPPSDPAKKALFLMQKRGQQLQKITLDDIFISLALKDPKKLLEQNPHLSQENLNSLYTQASQYLQLASKGIQVERCLSLCDKISKAPTEELKQELGHQLSAKRCYDIQKHTEYLVFEYYAGIMMREDQVGKLNDFLEGAASNPIMEMIMGSGKSKVLLPLLGLLRADGKALSMVVVPAPLFESVSSDTQEILQKAFSKSLTTLHFDRNSTFTKRSLEEINTFLRTVINKKQCLIMTSKSIQSLMLKFIEYANTMKEKGSSESEELKVMIDIISLLQAAGNPLIDEADTVLNVLHEVSFSLGEKVPPKAEEIELIGTLYELLYSEPMLKNIARLESDPHPLEINPITAEPIPPLSEGLYHEKLKRPLARALIVELVLQKKLAHGDEVEALAYLCRDETKAFESEGFFKRQCPQVQNLLALAAEELCSLLPHTLLKTTDERYGLDQGVIAIPYSAANTPSHGSVFSNPYITMNYTFQIHAKNGIQEDTLIQVLQQLKIQADIQMRDDGISLEETAAYQAFSHLKGDLQIPFNQNLHPRDLRSIQVRINADATIRQELIKKHFLPQMELFENKLACNPINLIALFSKVAGFTGTLWNAGSMHSKLAARPEPGTDAKTLALLMEKCQGPAVIIPKVAGESMFEDLPLHDALIDAGGYFKEGGNVEIARKMSLKYNKPVVFYNSKGEQTVTYQGSESPLSGSTFKEEQRLTFYDQSHTTGADVKQKGAAVGLVTIGRGMLLRDLLQSVWRLRGLEKGQTVQFVIDEEVASIIKAQLGIDAEEIGFKEILQFVIQNQAKQQGDDNFKAFNQELENLSQNLLLEVMTSSDYSAEQKEQAFTYLSATWIKRADQTPTELYAKRAFKRPSREVIQEAAKKCSAQLDAISKHLPFLTIKATALKDEIQALQDLAETRVHSQVISTQTETEGTAEVEQAAQVETQVSTEIEAEGDNQLEEIILGFVDKPNWKRVATLPAIPSGSRKKGITEMDEARVEEGFNFIPLFPLADQMKMEPDLEIYQALFKGIDISINVLEWKQGEPEKMCLLGAHRTPFNHLIIERDNVTLFSQLEEITNNPNYYNLTLGFKDPARQLSPAAFEKIVKLKFLNGESSFTKKEIAVLESWLTKSGVDKMETLYLKHILKYQHDKKIAFEGSNLERLFKKLKA